MKNKFLYLSTVYSYSLFINYIGILLQDYGICRSLNLDLIQCKNMMQEWLMLTRCKWGLWVWFIPACSQIWARVIQGWRGPCFGALLWREEATSDSACSTRDAAMEVAWTEPAVEIQTVSNDMYIGASLHIWPAHICHKSTTRQPLGVMPLRVKTLI